MMIGKFSPTPGLSQGIYKCYLRCGVICEGLVDRFVQHSSMLRVHLGFHHLFSLLIHCYTTLLPVKSQTVPKQKPKQKKFLNFPTSAEVLNFFALCFQTSPQLLGLFSGLS